jgi:hypothetical protein
MLRLAKSTLDDKTADPAGKKRRLVPVDAISGERAPDSGSSAGQPITATTSTRPKAQRHA